MSYLDGVIEIPMEEFWEFVVKYDPTKGMETVYGVPRISRNGGTMMISFAASSEGSPRDWAAKPDAVTEWEEHKRKGD